MAMKPRKVKKMRAGGMVKKMRAGGMVKKMRGGGMVKKMQKGGVAGPGNIVAAGEGAKITLAMLRKLAAGKGLKLVSKDK